MASENLRHLTVSQERTLSENDKEILNLFIRYVSSFNLEDKPSEITQEFVSSFLLQVLDNNVYADSLRSAMPILENYVSSVFENKLPWSNDIFHFYKNRIQTLAIDNSIDLLKFFKEWDAANPPTGSVTRFILPTPHREMIVIKQSCTDESYTVLRYSNRVYFRNGRLLPFPPRDIVFYDKMWNILAGKLCKLQRGPDQFMIFNPLPTDAGETRVFELRIIDQHNFKCAHKSTVSLFDDLTFCIRLKSLEQFFFDWRNDKFYKDLLDHIDSWIERFSNEQNEDFLFNLQAFYTRIYKLATTVYKSDRIFQKYLRELNTNIEFLKFKLDAESRNNTNTQRPTIERQELNFRPEKQPLHLT